MEALAHSRQAPAFLARRGAGDWKVPYLAVLVAAVPGPLAFLVLGVGSNNVFSFLSSITTVAILSTWCIICWTYLRLGWAVEAQGLTASRPAAARARFQPYLALYALCCCFLLGPSERGGFLIIVVFSGYKVFTRGNEIWSADGADWGYSVGPCMCIALFVLLFYFWKGVTVFRFNEVWSWWVQLPPLAAISLVEHTTELPPEPAPARDIRGMIMKIVNKVI